MFLILWPAGLVEFNTTSLDYDDDCGIDAYLTAARFESALASPDLAAIFAKFSSLALLCAGSVGWREGQRESL